MYIIAPEHYGLKIGPILRNDNVQAPQWVCYVLSMLYAKLQLCFKGKLGCAVNIQPLGNAVVLIFHKHLVKCVFFFFFFAVYARGGWRNGQTLPAPFISLMGNMVIKVFQLSNKSLPRMQLAWYSDRHLMYKGSFTAHAYIISTVTAKVHYGSLAIHSACNHRNPRQQILKLESQG